MATKLKLYNTALARIGQRKLATLTDAVESRRVLDDIYDDAVAYCLEQGFWKFAIRTTKIDYTPSVELEYGPAYAFEKPGDMVRPYKICSDEYFYDPLLGYDDDGPDYWVADVPEIYVKYVSNDTAYGMDLGNWPASFTRYVALRLAELISERITPAADVGKQGNNALRAEVKTALNDALAKDAMRGPTTFMPEGTWTASRSGGRGSTSGGRRDRGKRGTLIG